MRAFGNIKIQAPKIMRAEDQHKMQSGARCLWSSSSPFPLHFPLDHLSFLTSFSHYVLEKFIFLSLCSFSILIQILCFLECIDGSLFRQENTQQFSVAQHLQYIDLLTVCLAHDSQPYSSTANAVDFRSPVFISIDTPLVFHMVVKFCTAYFAITIFLLISFVLPLSPLDTDDICGY